MALLLKKEGSSHNKFTNEQICRIKQLKFPKKLLLGSNSQFDTKSIDTDDDHWIYSLGGTKMHLNFETNDNSLIHLLKYIIACFIESANPLATGQFTSVHTLLIQNACNFDSYVSSLNDLSLAGGISESRQFYEQMRAVRLLCRISFPGFTPENLEDLQQLTRPASGNSFLKYQDIENAFPIELKNLIARSIVDYSNRLDKVETKDLADLCILALAFATGMRPSQYTKLAVSDFKVDSENEETGIKRYSLLIPYAKQSKIVFDKVRIAIPQETGVILFEYIRRLELANDSQIFAVTHGISTFIADALSNALIFIQSPETKKLMKSDEMIPPRYTAYDFRHNIGHTLALRGASAEQISFVLGHSSEIAAAHYIMATPELAMIKSRALDQNPVWKEMIGLMMTGYITDEDQWDGRKVSGIVNGKLFTQIGGCERPYEECHLAKVRSCYGCFYFRPFRCVDKHREVLDIVNEEIINTLDISEKSGNSNNPIVEATVVTKAEIQMVISRLRGGVK